MTRIDELIEKIEEINSQLAQLATTKKPALLTQKRALCDELYTEIVAEPKRFERFV